MCNKFSETMICSDGCIAGKMGKDCSQDCPDTTFGYGCLNCSNKCKESKCYKYSATMECSNGCIVGYIGTDCSTVIAAPASFNITGKETWQSSNYRNRSALSHAAVDGCKDPNMARNCCTHTNGPSGPGWWSVDLGQTVILNSVTVFNRNLQKDRLSQFTIFGSNKSRNNTDDRTQCAYQKENVGDSLKLNCTSPVMARYIIIVKDERDIDHLQILTLCEVEIEVCPLNTYGQKCQQCGHCENPQCDWASETGACFSGCTAGYKGDNCQSECKNNTYGIGCQPCSPKCYQSRCDKFSETLKCTDGCIPGYQETDCSTECPNNTYGYGCLPCSEHCMNSYCDKFSEDSICLDGCEPGYATQSCTEVEISKDNATGSNIVIIVGAVCAVLLITILAVITLVICLRKRRQKKRHIYCDLGLRKSTTNNYAVPFDTTDSNSKDMEQYSISPKPDTLTDNKITKDSNLKNSEAENGDIVPVSTMENSHFYVNVGAEEVHNSMEAMDPKESAYQNVYENMFKNVITESVPEDECPQLKS